MKVVELAAHYWLFFILMSASIFALLWNIRHIHAKDVGVVVKITIILVVSVLLTVVLLHAVGVADVPKYQSLPPVYVKPNDNTSLKTFPRFRLRNV